MSIIGFPRTIGFGKNARMRFRKRLEVRAMNSTRYPQNSSFGHLCFLSQLLETLRERLGRLEETRESLELELRLERNKAAYQQQLGEVRGRSSQIRAQLRELEAGKSSTGRSSSHSGAVELTGNQRALDQIDTIQDATVSSVTKSLALVEESKQAGEDALGNLARGREQLEEAGRDLHRMEAGLQRADKLIVAFGRKMCQDRIIQWVSILNLLAIIGILLYTQLTGNDLSGSDDGQGGNSSPTNPT